MCENTHVRGVRSFISSCTSQITCTLKKMFKKEISIKIKRLLLHSIEWLKSTQLGIWNEKFLTLSPWVPCIVGKYKHCYLHRMLIQIYLQECTLSTNLKICLHLASFLLAVKRKSLISWICLGYKSGIKLSLYSSITVNHYVNTFKENQYHHYCYSVLNMIDFLQSLFFVCQTTVY